MHINISITTLDVMNHPVFYLKQDISEGAFCLRLEAEHTQAGSTDRASLCLLIPATPVGFM
jgi:hypothetical protein